jgi:hypothetical protein
MTPPPTGRPPALRISEYSALEREFREARRAIRRDARVCRVVYRSLATLFLAATVFDLAAGTRILMGKFMLPAYVFGIVFSCWCARGNDACERRELKKIERFKPR